MIALVRLGEFEPVQEWGALPLDRLQLRGQLVLRVEPLPKGRLDPAAFQGEPFQVSAQGARDVGPDRVLLRVGVHRPLDLGSEVARLGDELLDVPPDQRLQLVGADALSPRAALAVYLVTVREFAAIAGDTVHGRLPPELLAAMRAIRHRAQEVVILEPAVKTLARADT